MNTLAKTFVYNGNQKLNILQQIKTKRKVLEAYISICAKDNAPHLEHSLVHTTNCTVLFLAF